MRFFWCLRQKRGSEKRQPIACGDQKSNRKKKSVWSNKKGKKLDPFKAADCFISASMGKSSAPPASATARSLGPHWSIGSFVIFRLGVCLIRKIFICVCARARSWSMIDSDRSPNDSQLNSIIDWTVFEEFSLIVGRWNLSPSYMAGVLSCVQDRGFPVIAPLLRWGKRLNDRR